MADIAKAAKVSRTVVGAILNNDASGKVRFGEDTVRRVRELAAQMHYVPNVTAQMLAGKPSKIIGVLLDNYAAEPVLAILNELERLLAKHGFRIIVGQAHDNPVNFLACIDDFKTYHVAGLVCFAHFYPQCTMDLYSKLIDCPNVVLFGLSSNEHAFPAVDVDLTCCYRALVQHLAQQGKRRIMIAISAEPCFSERQLTGYRQGLRDCGLPCPPELIWRIPDLSLPKLREHLPVMFEEIRKNKADGFLSYDLVCVLMLQELSQRGWKVPDDIALCGFNNSQLSQFSQPPLSSVDCNAVQVAHMLFDLLMRSINGVAIPELNVLVPPRLILRRSSGIDPEREMDLSVPTNVDIDSNPEYHASCNHMNKIQAQSPLE